MSSLAQTSYLAEALRPATRLHSPWAPAQPHSWQRRGLFIQTQPTPNPASLMFMPGSPVMQVRPDSCTLSALHLTQQR